MTAYSIERLLRNEDFWRGALAARDVGDPGIGRIEAIRKGLAEGRALESIPAFAEWRGPTNRRPQ